MDETSKEISLNLYMRCQDFTLPNLENVTATSLPNQDNTRLKTDLTLKYYDERHHETRTGVFKVIRWDTGDPNRVILMSNKLHIILVSTPEQVLDTKHIHHYPLQRYDLLGAYVKDNYTKDNTQNAGMIVRADAGGDKVQVVLSENFTSGGRLVTLEETKSVIQITDVKERTEAEFVDLWEDGLEGVILEAFS
jgi:hypothetical protein